VVVPDQDSADERTGASDAGSAAKADQAMQSDFGPYNGASALAEQRESLEKHEFMLGLERGRLAVSLDMLTDALILIGQHGVYCVSNRNPTKPALDLQTVLDQINGAKQLIQSTMTELERKRDQRIENSK
jgi:hypothetical protein